MKLALAASAFLEKLEGTIKSRKKTAMDFMKGNIASTIAYNEEQEKKRIADMARYTGYAKLIDAPLRTITEAANREMDFDKYYTLVANERARNQFLNAIKDRAFTNETEATDILNSIQVEGKGEFKNKEAVLKELTKPIYKKRPVPIPASTPFGLGEKSSLREQQAFLEAQIGGRPELFSRPGVPEGLPRTDITGVYAPKDILKGGTQASFRSDFKKAEAGYLRNYLLSVKSGVEFKINEVLPTVVPGTEPSVNYVGIIDIKERRIAQDKVRTDMLDNIIRPLLTANGEIATEYIPIIQGSNLFTGAVDANGKPLPRFTNERLEGRTRVKLNDYYLDRINEIQSQTQTLGADAPQKKDPPSGDAPPPGDAPPKSIKYDPDFIKRREEYEKSPSSPLKTFVEKQKYGYDKILSKELKGNQEEQKRMLEEISVFFMNTYPKGKVIPEKDLDTLLDVFIYSHGIDEKSSIEKGVNVREEFKKYILEGIGGSQDQNISQLEVSIYKARKLYNDYKKILYNEEKFIIKNKDRYKNKQAFDKDIDARNKKIEDLDAIKTKYDEYITELENKYNSLDRFKNIEERKKIDKLLILGKRERSQVEDMLRYQRYYTGAKVSRSRK